MILISAYWKIGNELKWKDYGKKEVARHNKKMSGIELSIQADFDIDGWEVEGHFITPFSKSSREFVGLKDTVVDNKVSFPLEDTVTKYMGDWLFEAILKGPAGEVYTAKDKLAYKVVETAAGMSFNEILSEEDSSTVDAARKGLESAIKDAESTTEDLEGTIQTGNNLDTTLNETIATGQALDTALNETIVTGETKDTELKQSIVDAEAKRLELVVEGDTQEARIIAEGDAQVERIEEPVNGLEKRVVDVEEIVVSDTIRVGLYNPNDGLPTPVSNYGNQYWEANADGILDIPGLGETDVEQFSKLYWMDDSRWEYITARSDLLPKGDGLQAGTAKDLEDEIVKQGEQIQNCVQSLDDSLVAVVSDKGISNNVQGANVLNLGGNVIEGEGVSFVKTSEGFGIGEGYENKFINFNANPNIENLGDGKYKLKANQDGSTTYYNLTDNGFSGSEKVNFSFKVIETNFKNGASFRNAGLSPYVTDIVEDYNMMNTGAGGDPITSVSLASSGATADGDYIIISDVFVCNTVGNKVPFVPFACGDGELVTESSYNETDYTIISLDEDGVEQEYYLDSNGKVNFHLAQDGVTKINYISFAGVYKKLTDEKKAEQIALINSKKYTVSTEMQGTTLPVESMQKRINNYGIVADTIETDVSRDLWYVDKPSVYTVIDKVTAVSTNVIVKDDLSLVGSGLADISGRLRATGDSYVRKVK